MRSRIIGFGLVPVACCAGRLPDVGDIDFALLPAREPLFGKLNAGVQLQGVQLELGPLQRRQRFAEIVVAREQFLAS
jgi:hypothetical protein